MSTIHKAKGKEFDNVFLMLEGVNQLTDEFRRQLYVATTRAKRNLVIHFNGNCFDGITVADQEIKEDREVYLPPVRLIYQLGLKDVWLGYFKYIQHSVSQLYSGETFILTSDGCMDVNGHIVLKFSKRFMTEIASKKSKNYTLKTAKVNFIIYWKAENAEHEIRIILPELSFERDQSF